MPLLFASNNHLDFDNQGTSVFRQTQTTNNWFDTNYVSGALLVPSSTSPSSAYLGFPEFPAPSGTEVWFHFNWRNSGTPQTSYTGHFFSVLDASENEIAQINLGDAGLMRPSAHGDTIVNGSASRTWSSSTIYKIDLRVDVSGGNITVDFYFEGTLVSSAVAANTGGKGIPALARIKIDDNGTGSNTYSEIIVADEDTRGWRYTEKLLNGAGNYSEWSGNYSSLNDDEDESVAQADVAGEKLSSTMAAYSGPSTPASIKGVVTSQRIAKGSTGPQNARNFLRIGGTDYNGADFTPDSLLSTKQTIWEVNPATAAAWDVADLDSFEVGIEART